MTTKTKDEFRVFEGGDMSDVPVIASDIIFEGSMLGDNGSGYGRPLIAGDKFRGVCWTNADNSSGAAGDIDVKVLRRGQMLLPITGAVITDVGLPVYASDDNAFSFVGTGGTFIGYTTRFSSAAVMVVAFDVDGFVDPAGLGVKETLAGATLTIDAEDIGKVIYCTLTTVVTLPVTATAGLHITFVNAGPDGTVQISLDPAAADKIMGANIVGTDNTDLINTLATAKRGDRITVSSGHADGWQATELKGIWA